MRWGSCNVRVAVQRGKAVCRFGGTCLGKRHGQRLLRARGGADSPPPAPPHLRRCAVPRRLYRSPPAGLHGDGWPPGAAASGPRYSRPSPLAFVAVGAPRLTRSRPPPGPGGRACALAAGRALAGGAAAGSAAAAATEAAGAAARAAGLGGGAEPGPEARAARVRGT